MRAPPESLIPTTGQPTLTAMSITLQTFSANTSESEPPKTVKSWLKTHTGRPKIGAVAGDDGIAPRPLLAHPELALAMAHEAVELDERAAVEQQLDPLAREELAPLVLSRDGLLGARVLGGVAQLTEPRELRLGRVVAGRHPRGA